MINGKTFYQVLGVLNAAEDLVIRAAYRSLSNKYHPDKWTGDKKVAHDRMSEINAAYDTLGNAAKRQRYDEDLNKQGKYDDAADIDNDTGDFEGIYSEHSDAWDIAIQFYPDLKALHERLRTINSALAYTFKTTLLEKKQFAQGKELAAQLDHAFLVTYFGKDKSILALARYLITNNCRPVARELNRIISVMGASVSSAQVEEVLRKLYPDVIDLYNILMRAQAHLRLNLKDQLRLLTIAGVKKIDIEPHWWARKYVFTWIDGTEQRFDQIDLEKFVWSHVPALYE